MHPPEVAVVVPCYNEARRLAVPRIEEFLRNSCVKLIFVDDGSRDNTGELLSSIRGRTDQVTVLRNTPNRGKAEAVRVGMNRAFERGADYAGYWDADLATPLEAIPDFVEVLEARPELDMVFGARVKLLGRTVERRAIRHYLGRIFATFVSTMLGLAIYDTQCGAKLFRVDADTRPLFAEPFLSRWVFDVELISRYIRQAGSPAAAAAKIYEYPLQTWKDIQGSKVKPSDFFVAFWDVMRIRRKYGRKA